MSTHKSATEETDPHPFAYQGRSFLPAIVQRTRRTRQRVSAPRRNFSRGASVEHACSFFTKAALPPPSPMNLLLGNGGLTRERRSAAFPNVDPSRPATNRTNQAQASLVRFARPSTLDICLPMFVDADVPNMNFRKLVRSIDRLFHDPVSAVEGVSR